MEQKLNCDLEPRGA